MYRHFILGRHNAQFNDGWSRFKRSQHYDSHPLLTSRLTKAVQLFSDAEDNNTTCTQFMTLQFWNGLIPLNLTTANPGSVVPTIMTLTLWWRSTSRFTKAVQLYHSDVEEDDAIVNASFLEWVITLNLTTANPGSGVPTMTLLTAPSSS